MADLTEQRAREVLADEYDAIGKFDLAANIRRLGSDHPDTAAVIAAMQRVAKEAAQPDETAALRTFISLAGDHLEGGDAAMATFERLTARPVSSEVEGLVERLRLAAKFHESEGDIGLPHIMREAADMLAASDERAVVERCARAAERNRDERLAMKAQALAIRERKAARDYESMALQSSMNAAAIRATASAARGEG